MERLPSHSSVYALAIREQEKRKIQAEQKLKATQQEGKLEVYLYTFLS